MEVSSCPCWNAPTHVLKGAPWFGISELEASLKLVPPLTETFSCTAFGLLSPLPVPSQQASLGIPDNV